MADESQSVGTARVDLEVNTAQLEPAINLAKTRLSSLSTDAQKQYATLDKAEKRRVDNLLNQANTLGLSKDQQLAYNAALKTEGALLDEVTQKIARNSAATKTAADQSFRSQKQVEAALRGTPAQLTDIFVSLQGGQAPLTVLLQQGGQLKDMFGGIAPAARALGGTLLGLVNPANIATAAIAAVGVAAVKGSNEIEEYRKSIILSGNQIGVTVSSLAGQAEQISEKTGLSVGSVAEALSTLTRTGSITREQLGAAASAAVAFEKATGQAVDKTAEAFKSIQEGPVKAITKLNEQYNFLTPAIYKQIRAMEESGNKTGAAKLATEEYTKALNKMATDVQSSAGLLERSWKAITSAASAAWDAMLGFGRASTPQEQLAKLQQQLATLESSGPIMGRGADRGKDMRETMIRQTREAITAAEGRVDAENKSADAAKKNADATDALADKMDKEKKNADKLKKALEELNEARIKQAEQIAAFQTLDEQAEAATLARSESLAKEAQAFKELANPADKYIKQLERLRELGMTIDPMTGKNILSPKEVDDATKALEKQIDKTEDASEAARKLGITFTSSLESAALSGKKFSEILKALGDDIAKMLLRKSLTQPLAGAIDKFDFGSIFGQLFGATGKGYATGIDTGAVDLGGSIADYLGSFAVGHPNLPSDGFAYLHKGERVMTAAENKAYSSGEMGGGSSANSITYAPVINIDSRTDRAAIQADVDRTVRAANAELVDKLERTGR